MKKIKAASLIAASVIAVSSFGTLTAGAVTFTEDETTGAKTWTFTVNDSYPSGVSIGSNGDATFANDSTYYGSNGWIVEPPDMENTYDYLTLKVGSSSTIESNGLSALLINHTKGSTTDSSSTISWTAPEDGSIKLTSANTAYLYVNDVLAAGCDEWMEAFPQQSCEYELKKGDTVIVIGPVYGGIKELEFTPAQTYTAMYSFTETANDLNGMTLVINSTKGTKSKTIDTANISGEGDVKLGVIITNIPSDVEITSVTIQ